MRIKYNENIMIHFFTLLIIKFFSKWKYQDRKKDDNNLSIVP